jgi:hypothetical protein
MGIHFDAVVIFEKDGYINEDSLVPKFSESKI